MTMPAPGVLIILYPALYYFFFTKNGLWKMDGNDGLFNGVSYIGLLVEQ